MYIFTFTVKLHKVFTAKVRVKLHKCLSQRAVDYMDATGTKTHSCLLIQNVKETIQWKIISVPGKPGHDCVENQKTFRM